MYALFNEICIVFPYFFFLPGAWVGISNLIILVNFIIMLSLGSMETDSVTSESCYNEFIYNRHICI